LTDHQKFVASDYVGDPYGCGKFGENPSTGGFWTNDCNITKHFLFIYTIGVRAIFGGGWIDFARKIWGSARKMNSRTNLIKQDETRKLDYIDCGKSLKNLYLHLHLSIYYEIRTTRYTNKNTM